MRLLFLACFLLAAPWVRGQVLLTEFLASNSTGLKDEEGNRQDWIEIYNPSAATVSLSGWYLTDDSTLLRKWAFPATASLAAGQRMVIFASSQNRTSTLPYHTNFKLSASAGNYLALSHDVSGGGLAIDTAYTYPQQVADISYGLGQSNAVLVGPGSAVKALIPTAANGGSTLGSTWTGGAASEPFADSAWLSGTLGAGSTGTPAFVASTDLKLLLRAETSATLGADSSAAAHPATNVSSTTDWVDGVTDTATAPLTRRGVLQFTPARVSQMTIPASTDLSTTAGTIMFWMKSPGMAGSGSEGAMLWDRRSGTGNVLVLVGTGTNAGKLFSQPGGSSSFYSSVTVNDNLWHHVAFTYDSTAGGTDAFFVDGVVAGSVTHANAWSWLASQRIELGTSHDSYWYKYNGAMDDVRFYQRKLTVAELLQIYRGQDETVAPGDVALNLSSSMSGVNTTAFLRSSFTVADPAAYQSLQLTTRASDGYVAYLNGQSIATVNAPASPAWNSAATGYSLPGRAVTVTIPLSTGTLRTGTNILALQGLNTATSDPNFLVLPQLSGTTFNATGQYLVSVTPGATNSAANNTLGPFVTAVTNTPPRPAGGTGSAALTINATVTKSLNALATTNPVQLAYRTMFGAETVIPMTLTATAGVYTAQVPTTQLTAGQMLRWRVIATDKSGYVGTAPTYADPTASDQYYGTVALDGVSTQLPIYHVFVSGYSMGAQTTADSDNGARGAIFYKNELYDNVFFRIKGDTTRYLTKRSHRVDFNRDHQFKWADSEKPLRELALNAEYVDPSYSRQHLSMWLHRLSGTGGPHHFPVRVQMNGAFWQLAFHTETSDDELLDNMGLDENGALYTSVGQMTSGGSGEKQTRTTESNADYVAFANAMAVSDLTQRKLNIYDQVDLPAVISYLAVARLTQEGDDVWANMDVYRHSTTTGEWRIIPFDANLSWGQLYYADAPTQNNQLSATDDTNKSHPLYGSSTCTPSYRTGTYNRFYDAIIQEPTTRAMLLRRMRTLMDKYLQPPGTSQGLIETELNAHVALIAPEAALDRTAWGWPAVSGPYGLGNQSMATAVDQLKNLYLVPRRAHFFTTHTSQTNVGVANANSAGIPASQAATLAINITGYDGNPTGAATQAGEYILLNNPNAFAADLSGWTLGGGGVTFTFPAGTVMTAGGSLYVSPNAAGFRARTASPKGSEGRFVVGPYKGQISARGDLLQLRDSTATLVSSVTTAASPTAAQQALRVTEINYAPLSPTAAELAAIANVSASDFEYLELTNTGATTLTLGGAQFSNGVTFTFPAGFTLAAGARTLIVSNLAAFQLRYPGVTNIAGVYSGHLDNAGEAIQLLDSVGEVVLDFSYDPLWQPLTNGGGYALTSASEAQAWTAWNTSAGWKPSGRLNGTPGAVDASFDTDGDGLPDLWESQHGFDPRAVADATLDRDGDGVSNLSEYLAGTDPADPKSFFHINALNRDAGGAVHVTFTAIAGRSYAVQRSTNLSGWSNVQTFPSPVSGPLEAVDANPPGQSYYRVVTPAP